MAHSAETTRVIARSDANLTNRFIRSGRVLRVSSQRGISRHRHFFVLCLRYSQEASTQHRQKRTDASPTTCRRIQMLLPLLTSGCLCTCLKLTIDRTVPVVVRDYWRVIGLQILHTPLAECPSVCVKGTSTSLRSRISTHKYMIPAGSIQVARRFAWVTSTISVCSQQTRTTD